jgi:tetratricopeptide (TPR) repeat protein
MGSSASCRSIIVLALVFVCGVPFAAERAQLEPLPIPDLSSFEEVIQLRLRELQDRVVQVQEGGSDAELAEAYGTLGQHYLAHTLTDAAGVAFTNAQALAPNDPRWAYYLGHIQERTGDHEESIRSYERVLELEPGDFPTLLHLGEVSLEMGENETAYEYFRRAVELEPDEAAAHAGVAGAATALDRPQEAVEELQRALELQPQATALHYRLALAYRKIGMMDEARAELGLRGETPVRFVDPLLNEIGPLQRGDLIEAVLEMAANPIEIDDRSLADFAVGHLGDDPDAPQKLEAALEKMSGDAAESQRVVRARLHYVIAGLYFSRADLGRSSAELDRALELEPGMAEAGLLEGQINEQRGDLEGATAAYSQVLDFHPDSRDALRLRARTRIAMNDLPGAIKDLEELCERDPDQSAHWIQLAVAHARLDELEPARASYRRALELGLDPIAAAQVHYHLGIIESRIGTVDRAVDEFRTAVELDPTLVAAGLDLAAALGSLGRYSEAATMYRRVTIEDPGNSSAWLGEATALDLAGDSGQAITVLEEGWQQNPASVELLHALARLLASANDTTVRDGDRAVDLASRTFRAGKTVERLETLAMALAEAGRFLEAVKTQKEAIVQAGWSGQAMLVPTLEANLARYQAERSCCAEAEPSE